MTTMTKSTDWQHERQKLKIGDRLENGAIVIALHCDVVLAMWKISGSSAEYVTWQRDKLETYWGRYFGDLDAALSDYNNRVTDSPYPRKN